MEKEKHAVTSRLLLSILQPCIFNEHTTIDSPSEGETTESQSCQGQSNRPLLDIYRSESQRLPLGYSENSNEYDGEIMMVP